MKRNVFAFFLFFSSIIISYSQSPVKVEWYIGPAVTRIFPTQFYSSSSSFGGQSAINPAIRISAATGLNIIKPIGKRFEVSFGPELVMNQGHFDLISHWYSPGDPNGIITGHWIANDTGVVDLLFLSGQLPAFVNVKFGSEKNYLISIGVTPGLNFYNHNRFTGNEVKYHSDLDSLGAEQITNYSRTSLDEDYGSIGGFYLLYSLGLGYEFTQWQKIFRLQALASYGNMRMDYGDTIHRYEAISVLIGMKL